MNGNSIVLNNKHFQLGKLSQNSYQTLQLHFHPPGPDNSKEINRRLQTLLKKYNNKESDSNKLTIDLNNCSIEDFLSMLKALPFFRKFRTLNFFLHEKGLSTSLKYEFSELGIQKSFKDITDFNRLFQSIRKSKNKSFGQSTLKGSDFEILGTFLARNFSFNKHNAILIISRDDFLPQLEEDVNEFKNITDQLQYKLELLLNLIGIKQNTQLISRVLSTLPIKVYPLFPEEANFQQIDIQNYKQVTFKRAGAVVLQDDLGPDLDHLDLFHKERIRLLGELLNTLRHEISNPLFGLKLSTDLISTEQLNPTQLEFIQEIATALQRCTSIIEDFTNLYKSDKELKGVSLSQLFKEVLTITKSETRQIHKNIQLSDEDKNLTITTNPTWLVQILFNLIVNASQALKEHEVSQPTITVSIKREGKYLAIYISDNGPGVPRDREESVFQPFYTTKSTGTGLGLAISRSLAKKLGGDLEYVSGGSGASFKLTVSYE